MEEKKKTYRISEAAELLQIPDTSLRFWETEFNNLCPARTSSGQRIYTDEDLAVARNIHHLLHERGLTIAGARRILEGQAREDPDGEEEVVPIADPKFMQMLQDELIDLRRLLTFEQPQ